MYLFSSWNIFNLCRCFFSCPLESFHWFCFLLLPLIHTVRIHTNTFQEGAKINHFKEIGWGQSSNIWFCLVHKMLGLVYRAAVDHFSFIVYSNCKKMWEDIYSSWYLTRFTKEVHLLHHLHLFNYPNTLWASWMTC